MPATDQEIIELVKKGEVDEYAHLVDKYYPGLLRYLCTMMNDVDAAEDICQEAFIKAYEKLSKYNSDYKFSTWLYKIGHNTALNALKRKPSLPLLEDPVSDHEETLADKLDKQQQIKLIRKEVGMLPDRYRSVISLHYWQHLTYEQISQIHEVPTNTIKTWLRRAKQELKGKLDGKA